MEDQSSGACFAVSEITCTSSSASVKLDSGEEFRVRPEAVNALGLTRGSAVDLSMLGALQDESESLKCLSAGMRFLSFRSRSVKEMNDYFQRKGFRLEISSQVVEKLKKAGYLDDYEFAKRYAEVKILSKSVGPVRVRMELQQKGIDSAIITGVLDLIASTSDEQEIIRALAEKRLRLYARKKDPLQSLRMYLFQRGFKPDDVNRAVNRISSEMKSSSSED